MISPLSLASIATAGLDTESLFNRVIAVYDFESTGEREGLVFVGESESGGEVYVTRTGKKYHREGWTSLRRSKIPISLAEAKQRYGPCGRCHPPRQ